jgi:hypothetical protein
VCSVRLATQIVDIEAYIAYIIPPIYRIHDRHWRCQKSNINLKSNVIAAATRYLGSVRGHQLDIARPFGKPYAYALDPPSVKCLPFKYFVLIESVSPLNLGTQHGGQLANCSSMSPPLYGYHFIIAMRNCQHLLCDCTTAYMLVHARDLIKLSDPPKAGGASQMS